MKILVTGATGFLGGHLIETLLKQGFEVRALIRKNSNIDLLRNLGVELFIGDLLDLTSLIKATKGIDLIYHCAAKVDEWGKKKLFYDVNVKGTSNLLEAAFMNGCKVVHTSSLTVLGLHKSLKPIDETVPYSLRVLDLYTETKRKGELIAFKYFHKGLPVIIVRPGLIWGPRDTKVLPRIINLLRKRCLFLVNNGKNYLTLSFCSNVSEGLILAGNRGKPGRVYHITDGEKVTAKEYLSSLAHIFKLPPPDINIPFSFALLGVFLMMIFGYFLRKKGPPLYTLYGLYLLTHDLEVDLTRAHDELGYYPKVGFREGIKKMEDWIKVDKIWVGY